MLHFRLCHKCRHGTIQRAKEDEDGTLSVRPTVFCRLVGHLLFMNSEPPEDCPYAMEHTITTQDVDVDFAEWISGEGDDETEF